MGGVVTRACDLCSRTGSASISGLNTRKTVQYRLLFLKNRCEMALPMESMVVKIKLRAVEAVELLQDSGIYLGRQLSEEGGVKS